MTEAAILLKETDKTILEIAVTFQYGSQEAFTWLCPIYGV